jgi:hypothetical protein
MKFGLKLAGIVVFALMLVPQGASAATTYYTTNTSSMSQEELIAYLNQVIAQLQAQLQAQRGYGYGSGMSSYGLSVSTSYANNVDSNAASLYGDVILGRASYARVWFDYGTNSSVSERSLTGTATTGGHYTFRADVTGLRSGTTYYFRAAAEDQAGGRVYGATQTFSTSGSSSNNDHRYNDEDPDVETDSVGDVDDEGAELRGSVDMNDFEDGTVFFVYGQDENQVSDVEDDYDSYNDVDEDGDDLQKVRVDTGLDDDEDYSEDVDNLENDETYYYQICVEYEDEDGDDTLRCGGVEDFDTDRNGSSHSGDDEPEAATKSADDVRDDEALLRGSVDMNDFENGIVFFVWGQDEDQISDVEDDYDTYSDVDEDGDDLVKTKMDSDLDDTSSYELHITGLDDDTDYYFQMCVQYEDEDNDDALVCGGVEDFTTDN